MLTHFSLFSGIGGLDLAAEWAGFTTVGQCEWADYPTKILEKHWPEVPRWRDIRSVTAESFYERTGLHTVTVISGGFPCQPFSVAGKQKGKGDDRYLWPEMLRVIRELAPDWVIGENVPGILSIAGKTVCEDLEREGYAVTVFNFEAAAVGAHHRRERVFFVANRNGDNRNARRTEPTGQQREARIADGRYDVANAESAEREGTMHSRYGWPGLANSCGDASISNSKGLEISRYKPKHTETFGENRATFCDWWATEPDVGRVANGIPNRVDRLKCLGNAVVPQQAYPIFKAIALFELLS